MLIREMLEQQEKHTLSPHAALSAETKGRLKQMKPCAIRPAFQHDRDRIIHCKAFRRLKGKTQVFLSPLGDHYRTRLTHTLEVSQIARTIARALQLNETLVEAIAMGHDLGHTPFGHSGETILNRLMPGGFHHVRQSLRVIDKIEKKGKGLNLTQEVREGVLKHSKGKGRIITKNKDLMPSTLEGQIVRISDIIAYVNHDLDDAIRSKLVKTGDIPQQIRKVLGTTHALRINKMVTDVVQASNLDRTGCIGMSAEVMRALEALRVFLYQRVYDLPEVRRDFEKANKVVSELWSHFASDEDMFLSEFGSRADPTDSLERAVCDYIAGMTDRFAIDTYKKIYLPREWMIY